MIAVIQLKLLAMMVGSKVSIDRMRTAKRPGVIIHTSSVAAFGTMPADPDHSNSKIGILRFTECCKPLHENFNIRVMAPLHVKVLPKSWAGMAGRNSYENRCNIPAP